jgi:hypothetical protein
MAFNKDGHSTAPSASLELQLFHWEHGDGAQHFSANPITMDNGDITLITMQELERQKPDNEFTVIDFVVDKQ